MTKGTQAHHDLSIDTKNIERTTHSHGKSPDTPRSFPSSSARLAGPRIGFIPQSVYVGIQIAGYDSDTEATFCLCSHDGTYPLDYHEDTLDLRPFNKHPDPSTEKLRFIGEQVIQKLEEYMKSQHYKIHAVALGRETESGDPNPEVIDISTRVWFQLDAVPLMIYARPGDVDERASSVVRKLVDRISPQFPGNIFRIPVTHRHEVEVDNRGEITLCTLKDYERVTDPKIFESLLYMAKIVREKKLRISFFNSTPQGGGVALMRHALIRLTNLLGLDVHWYVTKPKPDVFDVTKRRFHNVLQGVASPDTRLSEEDKELWHSWVMNNLKRSWSDPKGPIARSHVIIVDDPQVCAIIPKIREMNPNVKIIYRSHIEVRADLVHEAGSPQSEVWSYLYSFIREADVFVSHPIANFVPNNVPREKVVLMPASTDPLDGLNKPITEWSLDYNRLIFNRVCWDQCGATLDTERPYIVQIARFDPSKGIPDVLEAYRLLREKLEGKVSLNETPQLVICGHGSVDDPDATYIFEDTITHLNQPEYKDIREDVCVARLPPSDQLLNTILRGAYVALQLSHREGFEVKVTEALAKGVPVVAYAAGGIPHQIVHGRTGYLAPVGDCAAVAQHIYDLLMDANLHKTISENAAREVFQDYFTPANALSWLYLINELHEGRHPGQEKWVRDLAKDWIGRQKKQ